MEDAGLPPGGVRHQTGACGISTHDYLSLLRQGSKSARRPWLGSDCMANRLFSL
jgi:hypothetical protein